MGKNLSYVLRHRSDSVELAARDWLRVDYLLSVFQRAGKCLSLAFVQTVVTENDKQRFEFSEDQSPICARQGHLADVDLGYQPAAPPAVLYHGTATTNLESIRRQGLIKGRRHHVHMSTNKETMIQVAQRHGKPVLLAINAQRMFADGYELFVTGNHVWLTDHVPPKYIDTIS